MIERYYTSSKTVQTLARRKMNFDGTAVTVYLNGQPLYGFKGDMQTKQQQKTEPQPTEQNAPLNRHQRRALLKRYRNELAKAKKVKKK